jgi:hypothetical protein
MNRLTLLLLLNIIGAPCMAQSNPFADIDYDRVIGYNFAMHDSRVHTILNKDSTLDKTTILPGKQLTSKQTKALIKTITDTLTYGGVAYACFDPKHAFIFYRKSSIVALVEICFACSSIRSTPEIPAVGYCARKTDHRFSNYGFSKSGENSLMDFCRKLGLEVSPVLPRPGD